MKELDFLEAATKASEEAFEHYQDTCKKHLNALADLYDEVIGEMESDTPVEKLSYAIGVHRGICKVAEQLFDHKIESKHYKLK